MLTQKPLKSPAPSKQTVEERKKAERLAKLEAWKAKQTAEMQKKQREIETSGGARSILEQMDKRAAESMAFGTQAQSESLLQEVDNTSTPNPFVGKFDPKAIIRKTTSQPSGLKTLGNDISVPVSNSKLPGATGKSVSNASSNKNGQAVATSKQGMEV